MPDTKLKYDVSEANSKYSEANSKYPNDSI